MKTNDDIEGYLIELNQPFELLEEGIWVLNNEEDHVSGLVIQHTPPIITFRVKLMDLPQHNQAELFAQLLRLNATDMVAGAYGLDEDGVVLVDTLQSENLDFNEFQASIEALSLAIAEHYPVLRGYREVEHGVAGSQTEDGTGTAASLE